MPFSLRHSDSHLNDLFLFHNQKTNKIFYHLLGRLDVFLFISSLSGSIKFPVPFSFYNSRIGILFFSFLMWSLPPHASDFFVFLGGCISSSFLLCLGNRGWGKGGLKKGHTFAVTRELQGKVLNRKKYFFRSYSLLLRGMRTLEPLVVKWWLCWFKKEILYYWNLLCGIFPRSTIKTNEVCERPQHCDYPSPFWIAGLHPSSLLYSWQAQLFYSFPLFLPPFAYGSWH